MTFLPSWVSCPFFLHEFSSLLPPWVSCPLPKEVINSLFFPSSSQDSLLSCTLQEPSQLFSLCCISRRHLLSWSPPQEQWLAIVKCSAAYRVFHLPLHPGWMISNRFPPSYLTCWPTPLIFTYKGSTFLSPSLSSRKSKHSLTYMATAEGSQGVKQRVSALDGRLHIEKSGKRHCSGKGTSIHTLCTGYFYCQA